MKYQRIVSLLLGLGLVAAATVGSAAEENGLESIVIEKVKIPVEVEVDGVVEAVNEATVSAQTSGRIQEIYYDVNDFVPKGSVILRFRDKQQQADKQAAQAAMAETQARFTEASAEYERVKDVFAQKLVSQSDLDKATAAFAAAEQKVKAAKARLDQAQENLENTVVRAPYDGIVKKRHVEVGELANVGSPLISGFSLDKLRINIHVSQAILPHLGKDAQVRIILDPAKGTAVPVEHLTVYPYADPGTHTFQVRLYFSSEHGGLYPGMYAKVAVTTGEHDSVLIPSSSIVHRSDVTGVYTIGEDQQISFRQIRAGRSVGDQTQVLTGLTAGTRLALDPIKAGIQLKEQRHGG